MKKLRVALSLIGLCGCSHLHSVQTRPDGERIDLTVTSFFDSKSELTKYSSRQGDKTQSLGVGSMSEQTSGTNAVSLVDAVIQAAVKAAISSAKP